jgi:hypothetical protein
MDDSRPLPRRYDPAFVAAAVIGFCLILLFAGAQSDPQFRLGADLRFQTFLWLISIVGVAAVCRMERPSIDALVAAMIIGRAAARDSAAPPPTPSVGPRRWNVWGYAAATCYALVIAGEGGADIGVLPLHGVNQYSAIIVFSSLGSVSFIVRVSGPVIDEVAAILMAAYDHTGELSQRGVVIPFPVGRRPEHGRHRAEFSRIKIANTPTK